MTIESIIRPRSVVVVGASNDPTKFGGKVALNLKRSRSIDLSFVTARGEPILGQRAHRSLDELSAPPDVVVLAVSADQALLELEKAGACGIRAAIVFASGFGEANREGRLRQSRLCDIARKAGMSVLGPNCVGAANFVDKLFLTSAEGVEDGEPGSVALIAQSGSLGIAVSSRQAFRFSHFISTGNEATLQAADVARYVLESCPATRTIALLLESIPDRNSLATAAAKARQLGKRIVLLKLTGNPASDRMAALHTGSLSGERAPLEAFCRQHNIVLVPTLRAFVSVLALVSGSAYKAGNRLGTYTTSGGTAVLAAGYADARHLLQPQPDSATRADVATILGMDPQRVTNPLDTTGVNAFQPQRFADGLLRFANSGQYDLVLVPLGGAQGKDAADRVDAVLRISAEANACIVPVWQQPRLVEEDAFIRLYNSRTTFFTDFESPIEAMHLLAQTSNTTEPTAHRHPASSAGMPAQSTVDLQSVLRQMKAANIPIADVVEVSATHDGEQLLRTLANPLAMKVSHPRLLHKSDVQMVRYPISTSEEFDLAFRELREAANRNGLKDAVILAQAGVPGAFELLCGLGRDLEMGPYVVVAAGGIYTEVMQDSALALVEPEQGLEERIEEALRALRIWPILAGARGKPLLDVSAAIDVVVSLARLFQKRDGWHAMEVNPLMIKVRGAGAVVVDARVIDAPNIA